MKAKHDEHVTSIDQIGPRYNNFKSVRSKWEKIYIID